MIHIEPGLYVTVVQTTERRAPQPLPLESGFSTHYAYRVLGVYSPSETSEAFFILSNDRDEIWFISNRHLRAYKINRQSEEFRIAIAERRLSGLGSNHLAAAATLRANQVDDFR